MSSRVIDDFTTSWQADGSGLWSARVIPEAAYLGVDGLGMAITAAPATGAGPTPHLQRVFALALDLQQETELRFWLRSSRRATGQPDRPFYLALEAGTDPTATDLPWRRLLGIDNPNTWELQRLWLGDMPAALRGSLSVLRLRSIDRTIGFQAAVDDLYGGTPQSVRDVENALLARLDGRFTIGGTAVPVAFLVPEDHAAPAVPSILISPFAVLPLGEFEGSELIDNHIDDGAYVRPHPRRVRLDYQIDVYAQQRADKAGVLESIVAEFDRDPRLVAFDEPLAILPYEPSPVATGPIQPGTTPLHYRVVAWSEVDQRSMRRYAVPSLAMAQPGEATPEELPT